MRSLFNPDHLRHLCQKYGLRPSKRYGQNFLINPEPIERMISAAELTKEDTVIEVGPGFGVLTLPLTERAQKVFAFEIEKKLQPYWEEQVKKYKNVEIVWGNVLKEFSIFNFQFSKNYKVVANLPYQITSPLIRAFLEAEHPPKSMALMVQKEVAERICAKPGSMSLLSVAVQYYAKPEIVMRVPRSYFWPEPEVDSAVIKIAIHDTRKTIQDNKKFFSLAKAGFAQRRKLLIKNLEPLVGKKNRSVLVESFAQLGLPPTARAQELSVEQWKQLSTYLHKALVL